MIPIGTYIHIPFCAKKCPYCDFYSRSYSKAVAEKYTEALIKDIEYFKEGVAADTVYFGGGTPSLIPAELIEKILLSVKKKFNLINPEITIEVNPCTVNADKLIKYRKMGINRLSVGVQSANNNELELLGRNHTYEKVEKTILEAKECGFENISADLMIGLPGQTNETLKKSIESLSKLPVNHISSYILKIEEGTVFDNETFISSMPDDDYVSDMYLYMVKLLSEHGFVQYEISNFSKKGFESKHNLKYWNCCEYIGFGPAAHSFFDGKRYYCHNNLEKYIENGSTIKITDYFPADDEEKIMLGLRLAKGIDTNDFPAAQQKLLQRAENFRKTGLIKISGSRISLTPEGFLLSNSIISELTN